MIKSLRMLASVAYFSTLKSRASRGLINGCQADEILELLPIVELEELAVIPNVKGRTHVTAFFESRMPNMPVDYPNPPHSAGVFFARFSAWDEYSQTVCIRVDHTCDSAFWTEIALSINAINGLSVDDASNSKLTTRGRYLETVSRISSYDDWSRTLCIRSDSGQYLDFWLELRIDLAKLEQWIGAISISVNQ